MSLKDLYEAVRQLLEEHNEALNDKNGKTHDLSIDIEKTLSNIKASGGTSFSRLKSLRYEDILNSFVKADGNYFSDGNGVKPISLAKDVAKVFRGSKEESTPKSISAKKVNRMTIRELVEYFEPEENNSVTKRLKEIAGNKPFIVYKTGRIVDVETTFNLLKEIKEGYDGLDSIDVGQEVKKVYKIGELPKNYVDENPIYIGRPLRSNGLCDQTRRSWEGVPLEVRQFINLIVVESKKIDIDKAHNLIDMAVANDALIKMKKRYHKIAIQFEELKESGKLPNLKIALGESPKINSKSPFDNGTLVDVRPKKDISFWHEVEKRKMNRAEADLYFDNNQNAWAMKYTDFQ